MPTQPKATKPQAVTPAPKVNEMFFWTNQNQQPVVPTVADLIQVLQKFPPTMPVVCASDSQRPPANAGGL